MTTRVNLHLINKLFGDESLNVTKCGVGEAGGKGRWRERERERERESL